MRVSKREFTQQTSKYLKLAQKEKVIVTHRGEPQLQLTAYRTKNKKASQLKGSIPIQICEDDINTPVLEEFDL